MILLLERQPKTYPIYIKMLYLNYYPSKLYINTNIIL